MQQQMQQLEEEIHEQQQQQPPQQLNPNEQPPVPAAAGVPAGNARGGLLVLTAAAFLSRQFLPPSSMHFSVDGLLLLMEDCLGVVAVDVVKALTGSTDCPDAARGFWGSLFLGLMLSATAGVPGGAVERLVGALWERSSPKIDVMGLQRAAEGSAEAGGLAVRGIATAAGAGVGAGAAGRRGVGAAGEATTAGVAAAGGPAATADGKAGSATAAGPVIPQVFDGKEEPGLLNSYSLREFVSAVVVLLWYKEMHMGVDGLDCQRLHDQLLQVKEGKENGVLYISQLMALLMR